MDQSSQPHTPSPGDNNYSDSDSPDTVSLTDCVFEYVEWNPPMRLRDIANRFIPDLPPPVPAREHPGDARRTAVAKDGAHQHLVTMAPFTHQRFSSLAPALLVKKAAAAGRYHPRAAMTMRQSMATMYADKYQPEHLAMFGPRFHEYREAAQDSLYEDGMQRIAAAYISNHVIMKQQTEFTAKYTTSDPMTESSASILPPILGLKRGYRYPQSLIEEDEARDREASTTVSAVPGPPTLATYDLPQFLQEQSVDEVCATAAKEHFYLTPYRVAVFHYRLARALQVALLQKEQEQYWQPKRIGLQDTLYVGSKPYLHEALKHATQVIFSIVETIIADAQEMRTRTVQTTVRDALDLHTVTAKEHLLMEAVDLRRYVAKNTEIAAQAIPLVTRDGEVYASQRRHETYYELGQLVEDHRLNTSAPDMHLIAEETSIDKFLYLINGHVRLDMQKQQQEIWIQPSSLDILEGYGKEPYPMKARLPEVTVAESTNRLIESSADERAKHPTVAIHTRPVSEEQTRSSATVKTIHVPAHTLPHPHDMYTASTIRTPRHKYNKRLRNETKQQREIYQHILRNARAIDAAHIIPEEAGIDHSAIYAAFEHHVNAMDNTSFLLLRMGVILGCEILPADLIEDVNEFRAATSFFPPM